MASTTASASSTAPLPPFSKCVQTAARAPTEAAISRMAACSDGKSPSMALMATTGVTPWRRTMARWARRLAAPSCTSSGFSSSMAGGSGRPATTRCRPECSFIARTVVTTTAASGTRPDVRHLMLKKRSAPMSAPNPASVIRNSPAWIPIRSATTDELPWAMLPKGPAWTSTGVFSSVCSRLGLMASRMMTVMAPAALQLLGGDRLAGRRVAHDDPPHALAQVAQRRGEREDGHHLGRRGDVEPGLPRRAVLLRPEPAHDVAQRAVVDVEHALPRDAVRIEPSALPL